MFVYLLVISMNINNEPLTQPRLINVFASAQSCIDAAEVAKNATEKTKKTDSKLKNETFVIECVKKEVNK